MRFIYLVLGLFVFLPACKKDLVLNERFEEVNSAEKFNQIIGEGVTLSYFFATWCSKCKAQKPEVEKVSTDPAFINVKFISIDYDKNQELVRDNQIEEIPTVLIFKDGELKHKITGSNNPSTAYSEKLLLLIQ
jgi:thioredoxin 1